MDFTKMEGCGNDFLVLDAMIGDVRSLEPSEVQYLCDRNYGLGADGLVVLKPGTDTHAIWKFYNCDGSEAEMCGNAARCAVLYLTEHHFRDAEVISIETVVGVIKGRLVPETRQVEVTLLPDQDLDFDYEEKALKAGDQVYRVFCINTGVPHAVIELPKLSGFPVAEVGREIQRNPVFQPQGTNVTFFQPTMGSEILATTFERGVEKETLACGTGAAAAAIIFCELLLQTFPVQVRVPGGVLTVDSSPVSNRLLLRGPAREVGRMQVQEVQPRFSRPRLYGEGETAPGTGETK